jgi:hypothetical protein
MRPASGSSPKGEEQPRELRHVEPGDEFGSRLARRSHAHVQGSVGLKGEAAPGLIELEGGDAEIGDDAVDRRDADRSEMLCQRSEGAVEHGEAGLARGEAVAAGGGRRIAVQADDPAGRGCENGAAVSAPAEGRIDEELSCGRGEGGEHGVDEDGSWLMAGTRERSTSWPQLSFQPALQGAGTLSAWTSAVASPVSTAVRQ